MHTEHVITAASRRQARALAFLAPASHSAVGADGGAPAVLAHAPHSVMLADGGAPAVPAPAPPSVMLADGGAISLKLADMKSDAALNMGLPSPFTSELARQGPATDTKFPYVLAGALCK